MLRAGSAVGQCAVRAVGRASGSQDPSPENGNWDCSSRKYTSEASLRASSEIPDGLTPYSNFNRAPLFLVLLIF